MGTRKHKSKKTRGRPPRARMDESSKNITQDSGVSMSKSVNNVTDPDEFRDLPELEVSLTSDCSDVEMESDNSEIPILTRVTEFQSTPIDIGRTTNKGNHIKVKSKHHAAKQLDKVEKKSRTLISSNNGDNPSQRVTRSSFQRQQESEMVVVAEKSGKRKSSNPYGNEPSLKHVRIKRGGRPPRDISENITQDSGISVGQTANETITIADESTLENPGERNNSSRDVVRLKDQVPKQPLQVEVKMPSKKGKTRSKSVRRFPPQQQEESQNVGAKTTNVMIQKSRKRKSNDGDGNEHESEHELNSNNEEENSDKESQSEPGTPSYFDPTPAPKPQTSGRTCLKQGTSLNGSFKKTRFAPSNHTRYFPYIPRRREDLRIRMLKRNVQRSSFRNFLGSNSFTPSTPPSGWGNVTVQRGERLISPSLQNLNFGRTNEDVFGSPSSRRCVTFNKDITRHASKVQPLRENTSENCRRTALEISHYIGTKESSSDTSRRHDVSKSTNCQTTYTDDVNFDSLRFVSKLIKHIENDQNRRLVETLLSRGAVTDIMFEEILKRPDFLTRIQEASIRMNKQLEVFCFSEDLLFAEVKDITQPCLESLPRSTAVIRDDLNVGFLKILFNRLKAAATDIQSRSNIGGSSTRSISGQQQSLISSSADVQKIIVNRLAANIVRNDAETLDFLKDEIERDKPYLEQLQCIKSMLNHIRGCEDWSDEMLKEAKVIANSLLEIIPERAKFYTL